jgi:hypothetical protein
MPERCSTRPAATKPIASVDLQHCSRLVTVVDAEMVPTKEYPEGQLVATWIGIGIALFAGVGVVFATATDNPGLIGIGPALGVAVGAGIGAGLENKARQQGRIRELTPAERRRQRRAVWIGVAILLTGLAVGLAIALL